MIICKMIEADLEEVSAIEHECFTHPWSFDSIKAEHQKDDSFLFTAKDDEEIIGYIGLNVVLDEGYLLNVAVKKEYRKKGVATKLFDELFNLAEIKKLSFITLEVRESNSSAIKLYEKLGFDKIATRKDYYNSPKENALLYTKYFNFE